MSNAKITIKDTNGNVYIRIHNDEISFGNLSIAADQDEVVITVNTKKSTIDLGSMDWDKFEDSMAKMSKALSEAFGKK